MKTESDTPMRPMRNRMSYPVHRVSEKMLKYWMAWAKTPEERSVYKDMYRLGRMRIRYTKVEETEKDD